MTDNDELLTDTTTIASQLDKLLMFMVQQNYSETYFRAMPEEITQISTCCQALLSRDSPVRIIPNSDGALCAHYPPWLLIPSDDLASSEQESIDIINKAKFARGRSRFVVPCLNFRGKNVCRSSTLSGSLELYGRRVANAAGFSFDGSAAPLEQIGADLAKHSESEPSGVDRSSTLDRLRDEDCELMKRYHVRYICDFMVEYRKFKYWIPVTSSEKAEDHNRYHDFVILPLPYPGSEFFRVWRDSGYIMRDLFFDWSQPEVEVQVVPDVVPKTLFSAQVNWVDYKSWDITTLTKNYLKLLMGLLFEGAGGLLIHCVSGWDRTPLFVSLMRCLLWADDFAHQSLDCAEMLYFTLAYDWFLFGHKLRTRLDLGEEILRFAFSFLSEVASHTDLSVRSTYNTVLSSDEIVKSTNAPSEDEYVEVTWSAKLFNRRSQRLKELSNLFLNSWKDVMKAVRDSASQKLEFSYDATAGSVSSVPVRIQTTQDVFLTGKSMVSQISSTVSSMAAAVARGISRPLGTTPPTAAVNEEPVDQEKASVPLDQ